jgi:hypothetical protein
VRKCGVFRLVEDRGKEGGSGGARRDIKIDPFEILTYIIALSFFLFLTFSGTQKVYSWNCTSRNLAVFHFGY